MSYKIIKEIGIGMLGTVYLVMDNLGNEYAMKIEHILKNDDVKNEIIFSNEMYKKYPNHFLKIHDSWIDKKCDHVQDWKKQGFSLELFDKPVQNYYKKLFSSQYCSIKIYSLIDLTLKDIYKRITNKQYYDIFIQCLYVMYLCDKSGYLHRDWKMDNIGLVKTNNKYIKIFNKKIKTHGYFVVLIDYGGVVHKNDKITDLFFMFDRYNHNMIFNYKKFEQKYQVDIFDSVTIPDDFKIKIKKYLPKIDKNNEVLYQYIYKIKYCNKYQNQLINNTNNTNNTNNMNKTIKPKLLLPKKVIMFLIKNIYDIKKQY